MIIYRIKLFSNFDSVEIFLNLLIFEIEQFQKFNYFMNLSMMEILWFSKL